MRSGGGRATGERDTEIEIELVSRQLTESSVERMLPFISYGDLLRLTFSLFLFEKP